jgi:hypothetical protein
MPHPEDLEEEIRLLKAARESMNKALAATDLEEMQKHLDRANLFVMRALSNKQDQDPTTQI